MRIVSVFDLAPEPPHNKLDSRPGKKVLVLYHREKTFAKKYLTHTLLFFLPSYSREILQGPFFRRILSVLS